MNKVIVVDTETTGHSVRNGGRVIEIGAVAIENGQIAAELTTMINSGTPISYGTYRVHGISEQMLAGKPAPQDVWPWFLEFVGTSPLVAHKAPFNRAFINHELNLLGMPDANHWHCTLQLSRRKLPRLFNHRVETVCKCRFGGLPEDLQRHRALDDARMAARVRVELGG